MILGYSALKTRLASGSLIVHPLKDNAIQPNSIDIRLGRYLKSSHHYYNGGNRFDPITDAGNVKYTQYDLRTNERFWLAPGEFILGMTLEHIEVPIDLSCTIEGKSTIGRWGLLIQNAGRVDSGYHGNLTLELLNMEKFTIVLTEGMDIGQLVFQEAVGVEIGYGSPELGSKYQDIVTVQEPR